MKKRFKIPKYPNGGQIALELAPIATGLIANQLNTGEVPSDAGSMLTYGSQGAQLGAQLGSAIPGIGTGIGAGVGAVAGAGYGLYSANKLQKADKKLKAGKAYNQKLNDTYGAQNPDIYQAPAYADGGFIPVYSGKGGLDRRLGAKYSDGGYINASMIEVETGEIVADNDNITHIGKKPHSEGGDKLPVYPKGFKRNKDKPYAIAGGTVYSTQYSDEERLKIAENMKKVKYPISKGSKARAQKTLDHMAELEGPSVEQFADGGVIPVYHGKGGLDRRLGAKYDSGGRIRISRYTPMNTAEGREDNLNRTSVPGPYSTKNSIIYPTNTIEDPNKYMGGAGGAGFYNGINDNTIENMAYENSLPNKGPVSNTPYPMRTVKESPTNDPLAWYTDGTDNPTYTVPKAAESGGKFGGGPGAGTTGMGTNSPAAASQTGITANNQNSLVDDGSGYNVGNMSKYLVPAYNMFMGARKPEYATMDKFTPSLLTNPEKALLPNRLRDSRNAYTSGKNSIIGNMTAGQRNALMLSAGDMYNRANQDIYSKYAASEMDTQNRNTMMINEANKANNQVDYINAENKLKAMSAGRAMVGEGLSQLGEIGQLDERNANQLAVDELRSLLYSGSIPPNSAAAQRIESAISAKLSKPKKRSKK